MDRTSFHQAIQAFYNDTQACSTESKWTLVTNGRYQYLKISILFPIIKEIDYDVIIREDPNEIDELVLLQETSDPATVMSNDKGNTHLTVEYHIVYSPGYQVPVLYFNGYDAEGTALLLDELYQWIISKEMQESLKYGNRLSHQGSISQEEHPVLGLPFYYIHPCETQSMMRLISHDINIQTYIKTWLSLIGPTVGCTLSHQLFLINNNNNSNNI